MDIEAGGNDGPAPYDVVHAEGAWTCEVRQGTRDHLHAQPFHCRKLGLVGAWLVVEQTLWFG